MPETLILLKMAISHFLAIALAATLGSVGLLTQTPSRSKVPRFEVLKPDEVIEMDYQSNGCFHSHRFGLTFTKGSHLNVAISEKRVEVKNNTRVLVTQPLGKLDLSQEDVRGLNALVNFYRDIKDGGCTTMDDITLTYMKAGKVVVTEVYRDSTCTSDKDLLRVRELVTRLTGRP